MISLGSVGLLRPWWLLAAPVVVALYIATRPRNGALGGWEAASDSHLLAAMVARGAASAGSRLRAPALLATLLIGVAALAGPAVRRQDQSRLRNLDAAVLVVDASQPMADGGRLRMAASAAHDVLDHLNARQAALIVYAGDAYVASALTDFTSAITTDLFALDEETVPDPGTRPDRALTLAGKLLDEAHIIKGDVILITSGGGLEGSATIRAAAALATAGRRVLTLSVRPNDPRSAAAIAAVASAGGGFAVDLRQLERLLTSLSDEAIERTGDSVINALSWRDLGRLVLIFAAVPLLLGFRKVASA